MTSFAFKMTTLAINLKPDKLIPMIDLSQAAASEIRRLQLTRQKPDSRLRLGIKTGGCSGLFYTLELNEAAEASDLVCESNGICVLTDEKKLPLSQRSEIRLLRRPHGRWLSLLQS